MLRREDFLMIQSRVKAGVYQKDIAAELGVNPNDHERRSPGKSESSAYRGQNRRRSGDSEIGDHETFSIGVDTWSAPRISAHLRS